MKGIQIPASISKEVQMVTLVEIDFGALSTVICNKLQRIVISRRNPNGYYSKATAITNLVSTKLTIFRSNTHEVWASVSRKTREELIAKALLLGVRINQGTSWFSTSPVGSWTDEFRKNEFKVKKLVIEQKDSYTIANALPHEEDFRQELLRAIESRGKLKMTIGA